MKKLTNMELIALKGGSAGYDCMAILQYEASTHRKTNNKGAEDAYWDDWGRRYEDCIKTN